MKCANSKCEKISYCEKVHNMNGIKFGEDETIIIPNQFYFELNFSNRLAKRGIKSDGFEFGCIKLEEGENESGLLYVDNELITSFQLGELIDNCNNALREMVASGEVKIR
ncbi:hypothetical protein [Clostridium sp.]|uniref:hypothetical protein n=1 Tax=Clostridium sp. TaxID=1506 RepID=UPI001DC29EAF|nr:hypothetical protein [Clostridium sp.]MBS5985249.1 hypothetical protein [Clostridium sp.]